MNHAYEYQYQFNTLNNYMYMQIFPYFISKMQNKIILIDQLEIQLAPNFC